MNPVDADMHSDHTEHHNYFIYSARGPHTRPSKRQRDRTSSSSFKVEEFGRLTGNSSKG